MPTPLWTIDQACSRLGISRRQVIALIADGKLNWTLSSDHGTVLIQAPTDAGPAESTTREAGGAASPVRAAAPAGHGHGTRARGTDGPAITDVDAWSQPK
ncbi:MAG: hypothetical protein AB7I13_18030 [Vicinamibacterales bacterium]